MKITRKVMMGLGLSALGILSIPVALGLLRKADNSGLNTDRTLALAGLYACGPGACGPGKCGGAAVHKKDIKGVKVQCSIEGMTCTGCEKAVASKLSELEAVKIVDISYEQDMAVLVVDTSKVKFDEIKAAVKEAGFNPGDCKILD